MYRIYLQRLKPGDPILSFRQCERHTFSMRADREVRYCITVQQLENGEHSMVTTGIVSQRFGLGEKTSKSEVRHDKRVYFLIFSEIVHNTGTEPISKDPIQPFSLAVNYS